MITQERPTSARDQVATVSPIHVRKLGHVVYRVSNMERSVKFWTEMLGFRVSDVNEKGMVFLTMGPGHDHHTVGLTQVAEDELDMGESRLGVEHWAMELAGMADLVAAREFLQSKGIKLTFEGRKGPGCNPGIEFQDPDGYTVELYACMDQIGWDGRSRPAEQWRRAKSLAEAVATPPLGVEY